MAEQNINKRYEFYFGSLRLKLEDELWNISTDLFLATNQHSGPDTELKIGQFPAVFLAIITSYYLSPTWIPAHKKDLP